MYKKPVDKAPWLAQLEQQVEGHIQEAVHHFQNLDEGMLNRPSPTGGWSIAQCLSHLNSYGRYYLPRLKQGLEKQAGKPATDAYVSSWLGSYLTRLIDPKTGRKRFKASRQHKPSDALLSHAVVAEFIDQQEELLQLLRQAESTDMNNIKIPLSIAGWLRLPLGDVLQFMVVHTERHIIQAKRNG